MAVHWSDKLEDRFSAAFAIPGFYRGSSFMGDVGVELDRYFDLDIVFRDPGFSRLAVELLSTKVKAWASKKRVDYIVFLEKRANTTGLLTLAGALTIHTGIPHLVIRLRKDRTDDRIKFPREAGEHPLRDANVVVLTDYATTGRELQPVVRAVENLGGKVVGVTVLVWNDQQFNKRGEMSEVGISEGMLSLIIPASKVDQIAKEFKKAVDAVLTEH